MKIKTSKFINREYYDNLLPEAQIEYIKNVVVVALQGVSNELAKHASVEVVHGESTHEVEVSIDVTPAPKTETPITKEWLDSFEWYTPDEEEGYSHFPRYAISETLYFKDFDFNYCICAWNCEHDITIPIESIDNKGHLLNLCKAFKFELKRKEQDEK